MIATKKIILAEDNPADVQLTKLAFEEVAPGLEVVHVADGQALVEYVSTAALSDIALILLDLNMPRMGGIDVLKRFYQDEEFKKLPVVVFSSSASQDDVSTCYDLGANAYVCKPIDINDFNNIIRAIASFWGEINVLPEYKETSV